MRVSASDLDAYRYWRDKPEPEDADAADPAADLAALIAQLRKESGQTEAMRVGTALHTALEHAPPGDFDYLEADGYRFEFPEDVTVELTPIRELKAEKVFEIDGVRVTVVGKVDGLFGNRVDDHKFTGRFDPERFHDSYQWRVYLVVFGATRFRWNVFEGRAVDAQTYRIFGFHRVEQYAYPGMALDVARELREFIAFARVHLPERFIQEERCAA